MTGAGDTVVGTDDGAWLAPCFDAPWRPLGLTGKWVFTLSEDEGGRLLAGTLGHGVHALELPEHGWDESDMVWRQSNEGMKDPMVYGLHVRAGGREILAATGAVVNGHKTGGVFRSGDGGRCWDTTDHEPITVYRVMEDSRGTFYAGARRCHILRSEDGHSWEQTHPDLLDDHKLYAMAIDVDDTLYLGAGALLLRSEDGADSWEVVGDGLDGVTVYDLGVGLDGAVIAATSCGPYRSDDRGETWVPGRLRLNPL